MPFPPGSMSACLWAASSESHLRPAAPAGACLGAPPTVHPILCYLSLGVSEELVGAGQAGGASGVGGGHGGPEGRGREEIPCAPAPLIQKQAGTGAEAVSPQSPFHLGLRLGGPGPLAKPCATWGLVTGQSLRAESAMALVLGPRLAVGEHDLHLPWPSTPSPARLPSPLGTASGNKN